MVAHEIFHGVTDATARLEYADQPGALNESFSDIFGIIITNLDEPDPRRWNWELGERLHRDVPFRDLEDPTGTASRPTWTTSWSCPTPRPATGVACTSTAASPTRPPT